MFDTMDDNGRSFLEKLSEKTGADPSITVSMYEIGEEMGLERAAASRTAEDLIALNMVEVRSLSGGIAITEEGIAEIRTHSDLASAPGAGSIGEGPILSQTDMEIIDAVLARMKVEIGRQGLSYDAVAEIMADIKTVEAQADSPKAKTEIAALCLKNISSVLLQAGVLKNICDEIRCLLVK